MKRINSTSPNKTTNYFPGKPYSQFPVQIHPKNLHLSPKYRNPGLLNLHRTIDPNAYKHYQQQSQSSLIRKLGDNYQNKLHKLYNQQKTHKSYHNNYHGLKKNNVKNSRCSLSCRRNEEYQMKNWYRERVGALEMYYQKYMVKLQGQLGENHLGAEERVQLLNRMNKLWEEEIPGKVKVCFEQ